MQFFLENEQATLEMAQRFAQILKTNSPNRLAKHGSISARGGTLRGGLVVYLKGDLGAGKSCFSRGLIQAFYPGQKVKSPTYTLVETYGESPWIIHHFDLYRLCDPEELEYLGFRDLLENAALLLIEWPQKAHGVLAEADVEIELTPQAQGRLIRFVAHSEPAKAFLQQLECLLDSSNN